MKTIYEFRIRFANEESANYIDVPFIGTAKAILEYYMKNTELFEEFRFEIKCKD